VGIDFIFDEFREDLLIIVEMSPRSYQLPLAPPPPELPPPKDDPLLLLELEPDELEL
jgi:hypothetical protein